MQDGNSFANCEHIGLNHRDVGPVVIKNLPILLKMASLTVLCVAPDA
jgi:hypothetical protein